MRLQTKWRIVGGVALACAGAMTWHGAEAAFPRQSVGAFFLYWGICVLCLAVAVFIAIFDLRYIRMRYAMEKRELVRESLADQALRKALKERQAKNSSESESGGNTSREED